MQTMAFNKPDLRAYLPVLMRPIGGDLLPLICQLHLSFRQISYWSKLEWKYCKYNKQTVIKARRQRAFNPTQETLDHRQWKIMLLIDLMQRALCQKPKLWAHKGLPRHTMRESLQGVISFKGFELSHATLIQQFRLYFSYSGSLLTAC